MELAPPIATHGVTGLAVDDGYVYWANGQGNDIRRVPVGGGAVEVAAKVWAPRGLVIHGDALYFGGATTLSKVAKP